MCFGQLFSIYLEKLRKQRSYFTDLNISTLHWRSMHMDCPCALLICLFAQLRTEWEIVRTIVCSRAHLQRFIYG